MEKEWMKYLNSDEINLFSLQFANCERIDKNRAVYMFDEVGSGKTISAGLMAMQCLAQSDAEGSRKNVLIITTPTLTKKEKNKKCGLFREDWDGTSVIDGEVKNVGKLTSVIQKMNWEDRIEECNNVNSNLEKLIGKEYALIIVDEAHLFLPTESSKNIKKQLGALYALSADRVVIATATPIKYSEYDLWQYAVMAHKIIHGKKENKRKDAYLNIGMQIAHTEESSFWDAVRADRKEMVQVLNSYYANSEEELCCCRFDINSPVTRYFKDSISCLRAEKEKKKEKVIRSGARIWCYDPNGEPEEVQLARRIKTCVFENTGNKANRMIVFFYFKDDIKRIAAALQGEGFAEYTGNNLPGTNQKTYAVVMGDKGQIRAYAGVEKEPKPGEIGAVRYFPDVLLVTNKKVEQGVNLQAYNYVLNYHIPRESASLEQRYGRVDRIDSTYSNIYMCYWLGVNRCSENNFFSAMFEYSNFLLASVPSRNVLLFEEVLDVIKKAQGKEVLVKKELQYLELAEKSPSAYLEAIKEGEECENPGEDLAYLMELCRDCAEEELTEEKLLEIIQEQRNVLKAGKVMSEEEKKRLEKIVGASAHCGDDIFYRKEFAGRDLADVKKSAETLGSISPIRCAEIIKNSRNYQCYEEKFREGVKETVVLKHFKEYVDTYLCRKLVEGKLVEIFPYEDAGAYTVKNYSAREELEEKREWFYWQILLQILDKWQFLQKDAGEEREIVAEYLNRRKENAYKLVKQTGFYYLIKRFERMLCQELQYIIYMHNPIHEAYIRTFSRKYTLENPAKEAFCLKVAETDGRLTVQASAFYKLVIVLLGERKARKLLYESGNEADEKEWKRTWNRRTRCVTYRETDAEGKVQEVKCTALYEVPHEQEKRIWNQNEGYMVDDVLTYRILRMHIRVEMNWIPNSLKTMRIALAEKYKDVISRAYIQKLLDGEGYVPDYSEDRSGEVYYCADADKKLSARMLLWEKAIKEAIKTALKNEGEVNSIEADYISAMFADIQIGYAEPEEYGGVLKYEWNYILRNQIAVLKDIGWIRKRWRKEYLIKKSSGIGYSTLKIRQKCPKEKGWNNLADGSRKILREYCERVEKGEAALTDERWKTECQNWKNASEILEWPFWKAIAPWISALQN